MPFYDYRCQACGKPARLQFSYSEYGKVQPVCPHCGSLEIKRRISRVALGKSEDARMDSMMEGDSLAGLDENDPRSLGKFMRKMGNEMGEDLGDEFNEVVDRLEKGESPEAIEQSMPDLGGGADFLDD
ncbi:MAG: zinc ribbon domain-containing protein [Anaerolineae bacterium]|jgi:putative FmdB family regulatory protein|nr:zinc ribbon domain-containing protein [Anaerolineae bacterium]